MKNSTKIDLAFIIAQAVIAILNMVKREKKNV